MQIENHKEEVPFAHYQALFAASARWNELRIENGELRIVVSAMPTIQSIASGDTAIVY